MRWYREYNLNDLELEWWREPEEKELIKEEILRRQKESKKAVILEKIKEKLQESRKEEKTQKKVSAPVNESKKKLTEADDVDFDSEVDLGVDQSVSSEPPVEEKPPVSNGLPETFKITLTDPVTGEQVTYTATKDVVAPEQPVEKEPEVSPEQEPATEPSEPVSEPESEEDKLKLSVEQKEKRKLTFDDILKELDEAELVIGDEEKELSDVGSEEVPDGGADREQDKLEDVVEDNIEDKAEQIEPVDAEKAIKKSAQDVVDAAKKKSMMVQ